MELMITGRRALVTGAGRGIGRAIAQCLAREGVRVAAVSRTQADLGSLIESIGGASAGHIGVALDLEPEGAPGRLLTALEHDGFGPIDIAVHNMGGTLNIADPFCSIADWRKVYRFNFEVAVELNRLIVPGMQQRHWGRVVHVSSISAMV